MDGYQSGIVAGGDGENEFICLPDDLLRRLGVDGEDING